ncbi:unnamed protein product [Blepharisma stoltei]|uniref:Uncharacterized protein n=1 Tax=Blepharisma stoltei TaxID=1481888 RepID=A0AAU9IXR7_9CILI|nr:unnamed protein product [Blepharisma stoltei]
MAKLGFLILTLFGVALGLDTSSCRTVSCGSTAASGGNCVTTTTSTVTVNDCSSGEHCANTAQFGDNNAWTDSLCVATTSTSTDNCVGDGTLVTWGKCCVDADCFSGDCGVNNRCKPVAEGDACTVDEHCDGFHYCGSGKTCVSTVSEGKQCSTSNQCEPGYGCSLGLCTQYWSQAISTKVSAAYYCETNTIDAYYNCDNYTVSVDGSNPLASPYQCVVSSQSCIYKSYTSSATHTLACQCGGGADATVGYCPVRYPLEGTYENFYPKFQYYTTECSGSKAHSQDPNVLYDCESIWNDQLLYWNNVQGAWQDWALYSSGVIDDCASDIGVYDPDFDVDSYEAAEFIVVSALLLLYS